MKDIDPINHAADKMNTGQAVGEDWLYGRKCLDLMASGQVSRDTLRQYRSTFYFSLKKTYGQAKARKIEVDKIAKHDAAAAMERAAKIQKGSNAA